MNEEEMKKPSENQEETAEAEKKEEAVEVAAENTGDAVAEDNVGGTEEADNAEETEDLKLQHLKEKYENETAAWKDKYTRLYAEFDNFRKRTDKEKSQMFELGSKDVIEKLLPVYDNFERALGTVQEEDLEDAFTKGVMGIYKQLQKLFSDLDVQPIEAEGQKFDPNLHNAVMTDTESDAEEDIITQDLQKGYTFRGNVIRHSMVKVKK